MISSVTNIFSDDKVATADKIIGTWSYVEPAVVLSSDDVLSNIGGKLAAATVEQKLKTKMESYGLSAGSVKMTFDKQGNFTQTLKGRTLKGTYTVEDKNIVLKYSGVYSQIIGTTQLDGDNLLENLAQLAKLDGTLVFLMGLGRLGELSQALIALGKDPATPAAVLSGGNSPHPARVVGKLADIAARTKEAQVQPPAVIVVRRDGIEDAIAYI